MRSNRWASLCVLLLAVTMGIAGGVASAGEIQGTYVEARNSEVYTSHCFANSEMGLVGDLAVMTWRIDQGEWNHVALDGLSVVAVVKASGTLGDPFSNPYPAKAALIFDEAATPRQRAALEGFAKHMGGQLVETIVHRDAAPIEMSFDGTLHDRKVTVTAGDLIRIQTRPVLSSDSLCHLDDLYFAPLVALDHAMPAFGIQTKFGGKGLGVTFDERNRSNAYLGTFSLTSVYTD